MKIKSYSLISENNIPAFHSEIERLMSGGFQPFGSPRIIPYKETDEDGCTESGFNYFQAMVIYETEESEQ